MRESLVVVLSALSLCACTATRTDMYLAAGRESLCGHGLDPLGVVAVLPETAWRADQKDRVGRAELARRAIAKAFEDLSCGSLAAPGGIEAFGSWSSQPEQVLLDSLASRGVDTVVIVRIEELTPRLGITFSIPFLWLSSSEADFRLRALSTAHATVLADFRMKRVRGGPFQLRPAGWAGPQLEVALRRSITGFPKPLPKPSASSDTGA